MKRIASVCVLALGVAACGDGNPFSSTTTDGGTTTGGTGTGSGIPTTLTSDLGSFTFNPSNQTLTVEGVFLDADNQDGVFVRKPSLDVPGYLAFTVQDDPLDQHVTAYVQEISGARAGVVVTGGQFSTFNGGTAYSSDDDFNPPVVNGDTGLVTYAGNYVGITNLDNDGGDLLPVPAGTPTEIIPGQAAVVTGDIFINVDFNDNSLKGSIFNRVLDANDNQLAGGATTLAVPSVDLLPTTIAEDGTFDGNVALTLDPNQTDTGDYGGIFGGSDAEVVAGSIFIEDHLIEGTNAEQEFGIFVLGQCGSAVETGGTLCTDVEGPTQ